MKRTMLIALFVAAPLWAWAQTTQPVVVGASYTVNDSLGPQTDPHVSGDLVAYTDLVNNQIRYHRLSLAQDRAIPNNGGIDAVSDVFGDVIVFTRLFGNSKGIYLFDTNSGTASEIDPQPGSIRNFASVGGNTVAWVDNGITGTLSNADILLYDLAAGGAPLRLTNSALDDRDPSVSPSGDVISWTECDGIACDVKVAKWNGTTWNATLMTGPARIEQHSGTDGNLVAYESYKVDTGERDIGFMSVNGGPETILPVSGDERNPSVSGGLIAFERFTAIGFGTSNTDILLYDTSTGLLYQLTNTPAQQERLSDIEVDPVTGVIRVVYVQDHPDGENVYAFSFVLQPPTTCDEPAEDPGCEDVTGRPVLGSLTLLRTTGGPNKGSVSFTSAPGDALLCVENTRSTSSRVRLNGTVAVGPSAFKHSVELIERRVTVGAANVLSGAIAGTPGARYTATVYGPRPNTCAAAAAVTSELGVKGTKESELRTIRGRKLALTDANEAAAEPLAGLVGCSSAGPAMGAFALLALATLLVRGRRERAPVVVRRR